VWYKKVLASELVFIDLPNFLNDRNFQKGSRICATMGSRPVIAVTSALNFDSFSSVTFTVKYKSSFHCVIFLAKARIMPSIWLDMSFYKVMTWCNVTVYLFGIQRVEYWNGIKAAMTYMMMVDSSWVVQSGSKSLYIGFFSHSRVHSHNW